MPKVSVILPVIQVGDRFYRSMESILHQTISDMEIILVTDSVSESLLGATGSFGVADIRFLSSDTIGTGIEEAIQQAQGEYFFFLEEGQTIETTCLAELLSIAERDGSDIVLTHFKTYHEADGCFYFHESSLSTGLLGSGDLERLEGSSHRNRLYLKHAFGKLFRKTWLQERQLSLFEPFLETIDPARERISYNQTIEYLVIEQKPELVSVIIPIYNVETYLAQCLDSVIGQTYQHLDILLINDGSTDSSAEICERYAQNDSRIRILYQENAGVAVARNVGIEAAKGKFVLFVDSDDVLQPNFILHGMKKIATYSLDLLVTDYYRFDSQGTIFFHQSKPSAFLDYKEYLDEIFRTEILSFVAPWGKIIRKELFFGKHPIRFPKGYIVGEDKMVTYLLALKAKRIFYLNEINYQYRSREGSVTHTTQAYVQKIEKDIESCEQRMLDLMLVDYDLHGAVSWYKYILGLHRNRLESLSLTDEPIYAKISKKIAIMEQSYE